MNILDLFSGIGGFSLGLERTGAFRTVAFCEQNDYATRVLNKHWPHVPVYDDVRSMGRARLTADGIGRIDVVCGGFPCQDISLAGKGAGLDGERSGLWFEMLRIVDEFRPSFLIAENVAALRSRGLDTCLGGLAAIGYDAEWHCIPASAVGAPHRRDRVWIIAYPGHRGVAERARPAGREGGERAAVGAEFGCDGPGRHLADAMRFGPQGCESALQADMRRRLADAREARSVADSGSAGLPQPEREALFGTGWRDEGRAVTERGWWAVEPDVGRVATGVPKRVDRLRCLGNSLVPQIPEMIGRAILRASTV